MDAKASPFLNAVGYYYAKLEPLLSSNIPNIHLILSAIFPIYTGAHASLSRPSSAAKPPKRRKSSSNHVELELGADEESKMEGLTPMDAILLPLMAGVALVSLYAIIKWLEDPALLNKILNWYFSLFGLVALAKFLSDSMETLISFVFPSIYEFKGSASGKRYYPFAGSYRLPYPRPVYQIIWSIREFLSQKVQIRAYIRSLLKADIKVGPPAFLALFLALAAELYFNLVAKPWWLTNLLGFSLVYATMQVMSPTTSWTGTLILIALFFYDIYMVFFTPLMVTVATELDIPAKLLFPRPAAPDEDPKKQSMSMLGLGDLVLPGMMIGFALRFDLYLFYLRKQTSKATSVKTTRRRTRNTAKSDEDEEGENEKSHDIIKAEWQPATGNWGERFWTPSISKDPSSPINGAIFPKTYFNATMVGYVIGMLCTLGILQLYGHAQPALLYLVPGVLIALWGTALVKGDIKTLWEYTEAEEEVEDKSKDGKKDGKEDEGGSFWSSWWIFGEPARKSEKDKSDVHDAASRNDQRHEETKNHQAKESQTAQEGGPASDAPASDSRTSFNKSTNELVHFSISLPPLSTTKRKKSFKAAPQTTRSSSRNKASKRAVKPATKTEDEGSPESGAAGSAST